MSVRHAIKGFETHMHDTAAQARECTRLGGPDHYFQWVDSENEFDGAAAYERHLETRDWAEHAAFEDYERSIGAEDFMDAWHRQSPSTCPRCLRGEDH
jgi:hypothetical protein